MTNPEAAPAPEDELLTPDLSTQPHLPPTFPIVEIAASAGGLQAISRVLSPLPVNFPAAVMVVQHLSPKRRSLMAEILSSGTALTVKQAAEADQLLKSLAASFRLRAIAVVLTSSDGDGAMGAMAIKAMEGGDCPG